jgi:hypothetical protein
LSFQPLPDRVVGDVRGTLWLDAQTSALRKLELEYVVPGRTSSLPNADATMEFSRLPNGRWFVSRWMLNMPVVREVGPALGGVSSVEFSGWRAREGLARALSLRDAQRMAPPAVVMGRAVDSTTGQPLAGATVLLEGVGQVEADSLGAFQFTVRDPLAVPVPAMLTLNAARVEALGVDAPTREVTVVAGETLRTDLAIPGPEQVERQLCAGRAGAVAKGGAIAVDLTDVEGHFVRSNASILARWSDNGDAINAEDTDADSSGYIAQPLVQRPDGRFIICGVPRDARVRLSAQWGEPRQTLRRSLPAGRAAFAEVQLQVPRAGPRAP